MSFDREVLAEHIASHGRVARIVVASVAGSAPREIGAAMLVWGTDNSGGQSGTIGGGALEFQASQRAREALAAGRDRLDKVPLGPGLQQCCGGAVVLLTEIWNAARLADLGDVAARPLPGGGSEMPLKVAARLRTGRNGSGALRPGMVDGWMIEPLDPPSRNLWVWGAGHVGRAVLGVMAGLPGWRITWVDTAEDRFPAMLPDGVKQLVSPDPGALVAQSPVDAHHLIMTYSHPLDLDLCHRVLAHGFAGLGLIGSDTKAARFRSMLRKLGHPETEIARIRCPIGRKSFGKHPQAIAVGVAAELLSDRGNVTAAKDATG